MTLRRVHLNDQALETITLKDLRIRLMNSTDVPTGLRLGAQNNWNQLEADWLRFLAMQPDGCFIAELDGAGVGTAAACIFDSVAWVALVLVHAEYRRQGIGTSLMEHVLHFLDKQKIPSVRLDATPLGRPIYERLGFDAEYELIRYDGVLPAGDPIEIASETVTQSNLSAIIQLDQAICATNRLKFLTRLHGEYPDHFRMIRNDKKPIAYLAARPGANAIQLGPCVGEEDAALALLTDACQHYGGQRVYIDIPIANNAAIALAMRMELQPQRNLLRMGRGLKIQEDLGRLISSSGPEKG